MTQYSLSRKTWLGTIALAVGGLIVGCSCGSGSRSVDAPLLELASGDVDRIELMGKCLNSTMVPGDPFAIGNAQIVRDRDQINYMLRTLQRTEPHWRIPGGLEDEINTDAVEIFTKKDLDFPAIVVWINGDTADRDFGVPVKKMFEKYRQRTWKELTGQ